MNNITKTDDNNLTETQSKIIEIIKNVKDAELQESILYVLIGYISKK